MRKLFQLGFLKYDYNLLYAELKLTLDTPIFEGWFHPLSALLST